MSIHPERVLEQFGIVGAMLEALDNTGNLNDRVSTQDGKHLLLRTHRSGRHDRAALESEYLWLQYLHQHGLKVQQPMPLPDGGFRLESDSTHHSLLTWLEGEVLQE